MVKSRELTFEDVVKLRKEISLGSLFIADYRNSFDVDPVSVCNFFDGFFDFIEEIGKEDGFPLTESNWNEFLNKYDTDEYLEEWWYCFEECPLVAEIEIDDEEEFE